MRVGYVRRVHTSHPTVLLEDADLRVAIDVLDQGHYRLECSSPSLTTAEAAVRSPVIQATIAPSASVITKGVSAALPPWRTPVLGSLPPYAV
jgi:hypothetical protein